MDRSGSTWPDDAAPRRRVLLTGASGFLGRLVLERLRARGDEVVAVARRLDPAAVPPGVIQVAADLTGDGWQAWAAGCTAAVHVAGLPPTSEASDTAFDRAHRVATERVVAACRELGVGRLIAVSALGARRDAPSALHRSKWHAEESVRGSQLAWTIVRPAAMFGPGDGFTADVARALGSALPVLLPGDGRARIQPVAAAEVAEALVACLDRDAATHRIVELGGPEPLTVDELIARCARALGRERGALHFGAGTPRPLAALLELLPATPLGRDRLAALGAGTSCDVAAARELLGVPRQRFEGPTWLAGRRHA